VGVGEGGRQDLLVLTQADFGRPGLAGAWAMGRHGGLPSPFPSCFHGLHMRKRQPKRQQMAATGMELGLRKSRERELDFERSASVHPAPMVDPFGRAISYLRVSVTDRCDFRCVYCMAENMTFLPKADLLTLEELDRLCSAFIVKGVCKLRLTGGEPLVRRGIMTLVQALS